MPNPPVSPPPPTSRDLRRDRSILALAAALCGALGAAGLAALAVSAQLSTDHHDRAIADASLALSSATELLERTRDELEAERKADRCTPHNPNPAGDERHRGGERIAHRHDKHSGHQSRDERPPQPSPRSKLVAMAMGGGGEAGDVTSSVLGIFATLPAAGIRCDSEHHCQLDSAVAEAAELLPTDSPLRGRFVPRIRDGERLGTKVYRLRSGSPMKLLGFRNGDTIRSIRFTRPTQLDTTSDKPLRATLSVELERKGETMRKLVDVI